MALNSSPSLASTDPVELLTAIVQPREDWFCIRGIIELLPDLVTAFDAIRRPLAGANQLREWLDASGDRELVARSEASKRGEKGLITEYPIHAMLYDRSQEFNSPQRLECIALVLSVAEEWRAEFSGDNQYGYPDRIEGGCRALRLLADEAIEQIPDCKQDLEKFSTAFSWRVKGLRPQTLGKGQVEYLKEFERFFRYFLGGGTVVRRASPDLGTVPRDLSKGLWVKNAPNPDSEFSGAGESRIFVSGIAQSAIDKHQRDGNVPEELIGDVVIVDSRELISSKRGETARHSLRKTRVKRAGLRRANRVLPGRWESLSEYDLRMFLEWADPRASDVHVEALLLLLVLITGRSPQSVFDCRVVRDRTQLPKIIDAQEFFIILDDKAWATGVLQPTARRKKNHDWERHLSPVAEVIVMPIPARIWERVVSDVWDAGVQAKKRSVRLFGSHLNVLIPSFERVLKQSQECLRFLRKNFGSRITLKRLEAHLFASLTFEFGDIVEASIVTGSQPPFGQSAAIYYQASPHSRLRDTYREVVMGWSKFLPAPVFTKEQGGSDTDHTLIGTPFMAREESVENATHAIREQLRSLRKRTDPESVRAFHNLLTTYTQWMLFWATGFRAVHDPVGQPYDINHKRGLVFIADKTSDGNAHHRAVPAPDRLLAQLSSYANHVKAIRNRTYLVNSGKNPDSFFIYVDNKLRLSPATPAVLSRELKPFSSLPINVNRHSLRSFLRDNAVPGSVVNAYMGHWGIGTEPWSKYSALDPVLFKTLLAPLLEKLMDTLGFEVVYGINQ